MTDNMKLPPGFTAENYYHDLLIKGDLKSKRVWLEIREYHWPVYVEKIRGLITENAEGFEWGKDTPLSRALALAILLEFFPESVAVIYYKVFAEGLVVKQPADKDLLVRAEEVIKFMLPLTSGGGAQ